jgi:hypothetical protein
MSVPARLDPRARATPAMLAAMGAISSTTPTAGTRPMFIVNTSLSYRVWLKDGLESRSSSPTIGSQLALLSASNPRDGTMRAMILGGDWGI